MNKTHAAYERHLNALYADIFSFEQAMDEFDYLTVKGRAGGACTRRTLENAFHRRELGTLERKYDSIRFYTGYNDWK